MASIKVTPFCRATRIISLASFALEARGFSQRTCFPCCMKRILKAACKELGTAIYTASIKELAAISSGEVKRYGMPCLRAKAWPVSLLREQTAVASQLFAGCFKNPVGNKIGTYYSETYFSHTLEYFQFNDCRTVVRVLYLG